MDTDFETTLVACVGGMAFYAVLISVFFVNWVFGLAIFIFMWPSAIIAFLLVSSDTELLGEASKAVEDVSKEIEGFGKDIWG